MTVNFKANGRTAYPLPVVDWVRELSNAAWNNAVNRRNNKPTMPNAYHPNKTQRTIQQAYEDALYLSALWVGGLSISSRQVTGQGLTLHRWYYARALLDMARLIEGKQRNRLTTADEATLRTRLETAFNQARAQPERFTSRVPLFVRKGKA